ncbi:MAG: hypothetical protein IPO98_19120 [Saprospiraceae bacterium]|nr:hypothetical protein [Saprospiraceae bacterium]
MNKVKSNTSIPNFISLYTAILNTVNENRWQRLVKETTKGMKLPENEFVANDEFYQFNSNIETLNLIAENNFTNSSHALENQTIENDYDYFEDEAKRLSYGQGQLNRKDIFPFLPGLTNNEFNNKNWYKNIVPGTFLNLKIKGKAFM